MALLSYSPSFFSLISSLNVTFSMCGAKRELQHADTMCACKTVAGWRPKLHPAVPYTVHHQMVQKSEICTIQLNKASNAKDHYIAFVVSQTTVQQYCQTRHRDLRQFIQRPQMCLCRKRWPVTDWRPVRHVPCLLSYDSWERK